MLMNTDMIPATKAYAEFGIPRGCLRELASRGIVRCVSRQIDVCHTMYFYSAADIAKYIEGGDSGNA